LRKRILIKKYDVSDRIIKGTLIYYTRNTTNLIFKGSYLESQKKVVICQSPHPYPHGVRVTSTVHIPKAQYLVVTFDTRSKIEKNADYLMFSRSTIDAKDLGYWTGDFPNEPIIIPSDNFVWSFLSDALGQSTHWGFRFTVRPSFSDETLQETMKDPSNKEHFKLLSSYDCPEYPITRSTDAILVQFIYKTSQALQLSTSDVQLSDLENRLSELSSFESLSKTPRLAIILRLLILKHFNKLLKEIIPLFDFSILSDKCLAYMITKFRSIIFYDTKVNLLNESLYHT